MNEIMLGVLPLIGVLIGGLTTYFVQVKLENKKEEDRRREQRFKVYSEVLMKHGESLVYNHIGGSNTEFHQEVYKKNIRPSLYSELYLLDKDIIENIKEIDWLLLDIEHRGIFEGEGMTTKEENHLSRLYITLINQIVFELNKY